MDEKKKIGNVNILDLRKATEESIAQIGWIGNANVVLHTADTAGLISHLSFGNLNATAEVPAGNVQVITGKSVLTHSYFQNKTGPEFLVVAGKMQVETDVSIEDIETKISELMVLGKILCPENLLGVLQAKSKTSIGKFNTYPLLNQVRFSDLTLDERTLEAMDDHNMLAVIGHVTCPVVLPNDRIAQKLTKLFAMDGITCHEENADQIGGILHKDSAEMTVIPIEHEWIEQEITLDSLTLSIKKARKLFCTQKVLIDTDVTPAQLNEGLASIVSEGGIYCPVELKETLIKKCDLLKTRATFYSGMLWLVDNRETLYNSFLEAVEGKLTVIVQGVLTIDPAVNSGLLAEHLTKIHNFGVINCPPELMGTIQLRLGAKDGVLQPKPDDEDDPSEEIGIGNANYLAL